MDLVQLIKPNENEDPKAPVLRAMEELKKFAAEAIILFIDKEIVELIVQQVILCVLAKLIESAFSGKKVIRFVPLIFSVILVLFLHKEKKEETLNMVIKCVCCSSFVDTLSRKRCEKCI